MNKIRYMKYIIIIILLLAALLALLMFNFLKEGIYNTGQETASQNEAELKIMHWINIPDELIRKFEDEYPEIKVKYFKYHPAVYQEALSSQIRDNQKPDIIGIDVSDYEQFVTGGLISDLSSEAFLQYYQMPVRQQIRGKTEQGEYAVALSSSYYGIWYNKDLFAGYGLEEPADYQEFLSVCEQLKQNGERPLAVAGMDVRTLLPLFLLGAEGRPDIYDDAAYSRAAELYEREYLTAASAELTYQQAFEAFKKGRYAMIVMPDASVSMCGVNMESVFTPGVFALPYQDESGQAAVPGVLADHLTGIFEGTEKRTQSSIFLNYLSRADNARMLAEANAWYSAVEYGDSPDIPYAGLWRSILVSQPADISYLSEDREALIYMLEKLELMISETE